MWRALIFTLILLASVDASRLRKRSSEIQSLRKRTDVLHNEAIKKLRASKIALNEENGYFRTLANEIGLSDDCNDKKRPWEEKRDRANTRLSVLDNRQRTLVREFEEAFSKSVDCERNINSRFDWYGCHMPEGSQNVQSMKSELEYVQNNCFGTWESPYCDADADLIRLTVLEFKGWPSMRLSLMDAEGKNIPATEYTASSYHPSAFCGSSGSQFHPSVGSSTAWCAERAQQGDFIEVKVPEGKCVAAIKTTGSDFNQNEWVSKYRIEIRTKDGEWEDKGIFRGNKDAARDSTVTHYLPKENVDSPWSSDAYVFNYIKTMDAESYVHAAGGTFMNAQITLHSCPEGSHHANCQWEFVPSPTTPYAYYINVRQSGHSLCALVPAAEGTKHVLYPAPPAQNSKNCQWLVEKSLSRKDHYYLRLAMDGTNGEPLYLHASGGNHLGAELTLHRCPKDQHYPNCQFFFGRKSTPIRNFHDITAWMQRIDGDSAVIPQQIADAEAERITAINNIRREEQRCTVLGELEDIFDSLASAVVAVANAVASVVEDIINAIACLIVDIGLTIVGAFLDGLLTVVTGGAVNALAATPIGIFICGPDVSWAANAKNLIKDSTDKKKTAFKQIAKDTANEDGKDGLQGIGEDAADSGLKAFMEANPPADDQNTASSSGLVEISMHSNRTNTEVGFTGGDAIEFLMEFIIALLTEIGKQDCCKSLGTWLEDGGEDILGVISFFVMRAIDALCGKLGTFVM